MKKVIIITGASSGMGKVTAEKLIKEGHSVYTAARRVNLMDDLKSLGGHPVQLDITKDEDIQHLVNHVIEKEGKIDVLINNAGYAIYGSVEETTIEDARRQFEVNIFGLGRLTQLVLPQMRKQKSGKIINISSMGGKMYTPLGAWYHATKHALEGWSDCLRIELKEFNIDVVLIEPGIITTEFGDVMISPMVKRSGSGPYAKIASAMAKASQASYKKGGGSDPSVIANVISKAIATSKPKTRYVAGKMAKPMIWLRTYLGDRLFDKIIMSQVK